MKPFILSFLLPLLYANSFFAQNTAIPDANFEQALINLGFDTAPIDGFVPTANIDTVISLDVWSKSISDLTGIEGFVALEGLYCGANPISNLNLSQNLNLKGLVCSNNFQLTSLDVSQNTQLTYLNCSLSPQLTVVDVRNGNNANFTYFNSIIDTNLKCIYVDDKNAPYLSSWIKDGTSHWVNDSIDCLIVSVEEKYMQKNSFNIYPNPNIGAVIISELEQFIGGNIAIINLMGQVVLEQKINSSTLNINLVHQPKGIYLVQLNSQKERVVQKVVVE